MGAEAGFRRDFFRLTLVGIELGRRTDSVDLKTLLRFVMF